MQRNSSCDVKSLYYYWYDFSVGECVLLYGDNCNRTENNFNTEAECESNCGKFSVD